MSIAVLIPAYQPDERLVSLVQELVPHFGVVVVDDGSKEECAPVFALAEAAGAVVLKHRVNLGKGAALKTGLSYFYAQSEAVTGVITADADGQHSFSDVLRLREVMLEKPHALFLGVRDFKSMPPRSRFGNTVTRFFFRLFTGVKVSDTQTGLRGLPSCLFRELMELAGERYEYEMNMLLALKHWKADYQELPIETIYIDNNSASHFSALRDGWRVFSRLIKYAFSSLSSTALDYFLYALLLALMPASWSYAVAKSVGGILNYQLNRRIVFHAKAGVKRALGYALLALASMLLGSFCVSFFTKQGLNNFLAKILIDLVLFVFNYLMQKHVIFKTPKAAPACTDHYEREKP